MGTGAAMTRHTDLDSWNAYLTTFHEQHAGITEEILAASTSAGRNPYQWLLEVIPRDANLLDLACGSAPLLRAGWKGTWTGVDRSPHEVDLARRIAGDRVVRAEADDLPFADHHFSAVACSMAFMLLQPLHDCLAEVSRVLVPGGTLVLVLPGGASPLTAGDLWKWSRLLLALRRSRLAYPNEHPARDLVHSEIRRGLRIVRDDRRRFTFRIETQHDAHRFIDSLYLPGISELRRQGAYRTARSWIGADIGIPLRRLLVRVSHASP